MRNLINFFIRNSSVFLFLILEVFSVLLMSNNKGYQRSVLLSSTNSFAGWLYEKSSLVNDFLKLEETNKVLVDENLFLKNRLVLLEGALSAYTDSIENEKLISLKKHFPPEKNCRYISAKVIRNTIQFAENYLTLNKGSNDSIRPNMGVVSNNMVVGIVETVSPHFSKVISVLNPILLINTKFKKNNTFGSLKWDGKNYQYAKLNDIPRHIKVEKGDVLVTSGFAKTFPEGVTVGTVYDFELLESASSYDITVKLALDYRSLTNVQVIDFFNYEEQLELEKSQYGDKINVNQ